MGSVTHLDAWRQARTQAPDELRGDAHTRQPATLDQSATPEINDSVDDCYRQALRFLARSDKTESELHRLLASKHFSAGAIEAAIARLVTEGLCDETAIAERFVEKSAGRQTKGSGALRQALAQRGISRETIERVLQEREIDDFEAARLAVSHYAATHRDLAPDVLRRRLYGLVQRRGFEGDAARRAIDEQCAR